MSYNDWVLNREENNRDKFTGVMVHCCHLVLSYANTRKHTMECWIEIRGVDHVQCVCMPAAKMLKIYLSII